MKKTIKSMNFQYVLLFCDYVFGIYATRGEAEEKERTLNIGSPLPTSIRREPADSETTVYVCHRETEMKIILVANGKRLSDFKGGDIKGCYKLAYSEYRWLSRPGREFLDNSVYQDVEQVSLFLARDNEFLPQLIMSTKVKK